MVERILELIQKCLTIIYTIQDDSKQEKWS